MEQVKCHCFIEKLTDKIGIVRAGPEAKKYGDPFVYAFVYVVEDGKTILKGMSNNNIKVPFTWIREVVKYIRDFTGYPVVWDRIKLSP